MWPMMRRPSPRNTSPRRRLGRNALIYAIIAVAAIWIVGSFVSHGNQPTKIRFDSFITKGGDHQVKTAELFLRDQRIEGKLSNGQAYQTTFAGDGATLSLTLTKA